MRSTWPPVYNPGEGCLAYDGSKVPDCREFIDPAIGEPYYHPHSYNCSRFWECGPSYETCLFECARCNTVDFDNPLCKDQWALTFDPEIQYPYGPVCKWPADIDCDNGQAPCDCEPWQSCVGDVCLPQCVEDSHCPDGYMCDDCNWCVEDPNQPECSSDAECLQGVCDTPWPYSTCEYCDTDKCLPGCSTSSNCPAEAPVCGCAGCGDHVCGCSADSDCPQGYICDTNNHVCTEDIGCDGDDNNCLQNTCDEPANWPYTTCEYCSEANGIDCLPGCSSNSNCPAEYPLCGISGNAHRCGCNVDADCAGLGADYVCDQDTHGCKEDLGCNGDDNNCKQNICDEPANWPYTTCEYCSDDNGKDCVPGCAGDAVCPSLFPVCGLPEDAHRCGCSNDADCAGLGSNYVCDPSTNGCTEGCTSDSDCPSDVCDIENTPYTTCTHCDGQHCVPGCSADQWCPTGFECVNWLCQVKPAGYVLLEKVVVVGASPGAYSLDLVGVLTAHPATCNTPQMSGSGTFTGDGQLGAVEHHGCYHAPLNAVVSSGTVTGGELWVGATMCFDWNEDDYFTYTCDVVGGKLMNCNSNSLSTSC